MQNHYIKCLTVRIPIEVKKYPEPTFYRNLTKRDLTTGKITVYTRECIYWLDSYVYTPKQLVWLADIKTKILRRLPDAEFVEYQVEAKYITASGKIFSLKSLQKTWMRSIVPKKESILKTLKEPDTKLDDEHITLPSLIPLLSGKYEYQLYQALCRYGSRLHYEKLLQFEYLYRAAKIYNKNSEEKVLPKKLLKVTHKAFGYISQQTKDNPDGFKQKLEKEELRRLRIKHGATVLQKSNKRKRDTNTIKVEEAIATNKYYKADGITVNVTAIANATGLSRPTVTAILKAS